MLYLRSFLSFAFFAVSALAGGVPQFNNTKCPAWFELQAPHVKDFNVATDLPGQYYELALHDITQYPMCPTKPKCITAKKSMQKWDDGQDYVLDDWDLNCFGKKFPVKLLFNVTETPGFLKGFLPPGIVPLIPKDSLDGLIFPDTVVDYKTGPKGWVLEFQCVEALHKVLFVGINFYAKDKSEATYNEIYAAAMNRGLGFYMNKGMGLSRVNQTNCPAV